MEGTGILSTIGNTPLVRLDKYFDWAQFQVYAKLESFNPGGSSKDRVALAIIEDGLQQGAIGPDTVIVESSAGNLGVSLAQICRYYGLRFICVVDPRISVLSLRLLRAYGAEVDYVTLADPSTGTWLPACVARVQELLRETPNAYWPNIFANPNNAGSHNRGTMREIVSTLGNEIDFLFMSVSTCGTLRGCADFAREHRLRTRFVAVDDENSLIFPGEHKSQRPLLVEGLGSSIRPPLLDLGLVNRVVLVTDAECIQGCRRLLYREGILAGGSSGGILTAIGKLRELIPAGSTCVAILPDRGDRYLDTIFDDIWVHEKFGQLPSPSADEARIEVRHRHLVDAIYKTPFS